ncbi:MULTISPECIES: isoprenyl transferase [Turicibacter]|jgi:di-trans,poly-cis-decaprenylcistransferase|uniref:Isoprenyl transferase n=5 Tax=Turicibacter sanguinis TaxID=154288 RepID=A0A9X4XCH5_9FIRM|nr:MULTISPECIES: isoprenyl transferase [Turicibacter]EFF64615.1 di-trans,poly-cis-decaprenylcistransferase [Turicibacter sanguinis PC909]MBP3903245.1 isoprenyl transferase [Turicibacter sp.]MCU7191262.1 isoprenyl transferase [Turicibacter sanguinis]MCU7210532.1 isoprenyl transferase [Turicibacter sanguinis]MDB8459515.1 isoprenyl transferase [Turicibacter sanguinis]
MFFKKKTKTQVSKEQILKAPLPQHIAIILDGNGRWAKKRGLPRTAGHQEGAMNVREITKLCGKLGVKALTVYAFSTENWKRPEEEVKFLMKLPLKFFDEFAPELIENDIRLKVIGNTEDLPTELQEKIRELSHQTKDNQTMTLTIALNYGSQDEIKQAVQQIAKEVKAGELKVEEITEDVIENHLMTHDLPPLDLMIRTSGEQRISNYLLWQLAYAELYFTSVAWPDFKENQLYEAIYDYQKRNRRFGGLTETK